MATHEAPDAVLTRLEADRLRARALELIAELDGMDPMDVLRSEDTSALWRWAGRASYILAEVARG